ncbi:hypothetical protein Clacol_008770 [Clathrus columnatus]|uniref:FAD-binding domain-containing protein n=1 Tax=Clathrus columnatus TaxID=1419009 RepID=A0AAV5AIN1_9AGAM|nr:hypothetical protein Clacol_008770 [Clathrus columnatus]
MTETTTTPVLITGSGPTGLVAALWLAQSGIKIRIIERAEGPRIGSRGYGLQPRTFELFRYLGVQDQVQKSAVPIPTMQAYKIPGGTIPVKTWDLYEKRQPWPDRPYANGMCLEQSVLEDILRQRLADYGVSVEFGYALADLEQIEDDVIATVAMCKNGKPTEETKKITAKYVIGADGAKGTSRKLLGLTFLGETRDADGMVWGDVEIEGLHPGYNQPLSHTKDINSIMIRPFAPGSKKFHVGIIGQNFDPIEETNPDKANEFIRRQTGIEGLSFGKWSWISYYKPNMRVVNKFQAGRVFIVGDAAHVHSPSGGQGINCGVQDASNIAWKIALVLKSLAPPSLLDTYTEERLPVITQMLYATSQLYSNLVAKEKPEMDVPENTVVPATAGDRSQFLQWRNDALELYGVNYRYSSIVHEERTDTSLWDAENVIAHAYSGYEGRDTLCAGDRAPDAPNLFDIRKNETKSLLDIFTPSKHAILVFTKLSALDPHILETIQEYPADIVQSFIITKSAGDHGGDIKVSPFQTDVLEDREGHAATSYRILQDDLTIFIVRPDSYIGAVVGNAAGIKKYFSKILV